MNREESLHWLKEEGFTRSGYILAFVPPNTILFSHPDGRRVEMDDDRVGHLRGDVPSNWDTLNFFRVLIEANTRHH